MEAVANQRPYSHLFPDSIATSSERDHGLEIGIGTWGT